jgi:hypothetical protein
MSNTSKDHPLILVCYMDREVMNNRELMTKMSENMNSVIAERGANMMAFFVPTVSIQFIPLKIKTMK